jgi:UTP--glucose-1-phosphate uridylyltransferase
MHIHKAVITAAAPYQRALPLNRLIDCDGVEKPLLEIITGHVQAAAIDDIGIVIHPDDERALRDAAGPAARQMTFIPQREPRGYGHAIHCAREFVGGEPFLHVVGDHVYVCPNSEPCARAIVELAAHEDCSVSAVQPTRETQLPQFGAVAGTRLTGRPNLYRVETVLEKPTPTEAEQRLVVPGLRAGYYLCFFGMHVLTPVVFDLLENLLADANRRVTLSDALAELARREQYLALVTAGRRYDLGARYGLLTAQLALALDGRDAGDVLSRVLEVVAARRAEAAGAAAND